MMSMKQKRDDEALFDSILGRDETILWMGQPNPKWLLSRSDLFLIPFSLMWGGFALFWEATALSTRAPGLFPLWGIPFVLIGQYFIWGRFIHKYLRRKKTYYAITQRRALVLHKLFGTSLKAYFLPQFASLQREGQSILFGVNDPSMVRRGRQGDWSGEQRPGFYALDDADDVFTLLQDLTMPSKLKNDEREADVYDDHLSHRDINNRLSR